MARIIMKVWRSPRGVMVDLRDRENDIDQLGPFDDERKAREEAKARVERHGTGRHVLAEEE